ncbi:YybH family protein [Rhizobium sp. LEGMi198b]|uniref:YybH family protein n=1 Tax=Rhizobium sp. CNPSo 3464 TaxID=3021406 RepID=UPI00254D3089|nr:nuclear transport factor 2 family protein [Rhizobium sp. CNPSo 3464]MDK4743517.1 nuclear transport factor 2 family protein [Rhizobium sp. CNPSo 3464]
MSQSHAVVELEKAAMARWCNGDPDGFLELSSRNVTYFDPFIPRRIDGLDNLRAHYDTIRGKIFASRYEFLDVRVEAVGDVAILTYHFHSWAGTEGAMRWNCTEVFRHEPQGWKIIQTHWSFQGTQ